MLSPQAISRCILPKLNSSIFIKDNYNYNNSILADTDKMRKYAIGWCYSEELSYKCREDQIAVMYEVNNEESFPYYIDNGKYWCHISVVGFIDTFIPTYFD